MAMLTIKQQGEIHTIARTAQHKDYKGIQYLCYAIRTEAYYNVTTRANLQLMIDSLKLALAMLEERDKLP